MEEKGLKSLVDEYLSWLIVRNYTESTVSNRRIYLVYFLKWCAPRDVLFLFQINEETIEDYKKYVMKLKSKRDGGPLSKESKRIRLSVVEMFFRFLQKSDYITVNPFLNVEIPKAYEKMKKRPVLRPEEADHVLSGANIKTHLGLRNRAILEVFYGAGLRRMEMVDLLVYDLDMGEGTVRIREGKGRKERIVPTGKRAVYWVEKYLLDSRPYLVKGADPGFLFLTCNGTPIGKAHMGNIVSRYLKLAGLENKGCCHLFRHTAVSLMLENGADMLSLKEMLGHTSLEATVRYTQITGEKLKSVFRETHPGAYLKE